MKLLKLTVVMLSVVSVPALADSGTGPRRKLSEYSGKEFICEKTARAAKGGRNLAVADSQDTSLDSAHSTSGQ